LNDRHGREVDARLQANERQLLAGHVTPEANVRFGLFAATGSIRTNQLDNIHCWPFSTFSLICNFVRSQVLSGPLPQSKATDGFTS